MKNNSEMLYERIGLLFYAAALQQKQLSVDDYLMLTKIIGRDWKVVNGTIDRSLLNELNRHMLLSLREAFRNSMSVAEALQLFNVFYSVHALTFDANLKNRIISTCGHITREFSSTHDESGKAELVKCLLAVQRDNDR
jgi:hypothetical protein